METGQLLSAVREVATHIDWVEVFGFVTGVANVWMLARQFVWNWPVGIANNLAYLILFVSSGLYGDAGLQLVYISLAVYGWIHWATGVSGRSLPVMRTSRATWQWLLPATVVVAFLLRGFLARFTDSTVPAWDGITTAVSLAATYGQCRKLLESWWLWILVDLIYIPLYIYKGLLLTSLLYLIFLLLCVFGLREWQREASASVQAKAAENAANLLG